MAKKTRIYIRADHATKRLYKSKAKEWGLGLTEYIETCCDYGLTVKEPAMIPIISDRIKT